MGAVALLVLTLALVSAQPALAHVPQAGAAALHDLLSTWTFEPWVLALLAVSAGLYARGVWRLWRHAGHARGITRAQIACFAGGWLSLVLALVSPLDALGSALFSAHMVQHELLMLVSAPLMVLGRPLAAWAWAFPPSQGRVIGHALRARWWNALWNFITEPFAAWALHAIALWLWHVPALFEAALHNEALHALQHASFLVTALLFWWAVIGRSRARQASGFAMVYLFTTMLHTSALGALLTLAPMPWYPHYAATAGALGMDPVEDQQLGGLVMWVPGGLAYLFAGLWVVARLLANPRVSPAIAARPGPIR
jgi:putative membrane protein